MCLGQISLTCFAVNPSHSLICFKLLHRYSQRTKYLLIFIGNAVFVVCQLRVDCIVEELIALECFLLLLIETSHHRTEILCILLAVEQYFIKINVGFCKKTEGTAHETLSPLFVYSLTTQRRYT